MAHATVSQTLLGLARSIRRLQPSDPLTQCLAPRLGRSFATATEIPVAELTQATQEESSIQNSPTTPAQSPRVLTTLYTWPKLEPKQFAWYGSKYLDMPLRRDILHRAVIFEADGSRQGTASTKWRGDVHGSNRKIAPQKGLGRARVGDKKSPIRRGGGVAFGPHPRDFSTELPRKIYDIAWRTALSHRYRKGELIVLTSRPRLPTSLSPWHLHNMFTANNWGQGNGRSLLLTDNSDLNAMDKGVENLFTTMLMMGEHGEVKDVEDVDVKDLLSFGRIIIDHKALNTILAAHSADLGTTMSIEGARNMLKLEPKLLQAFVQYSDNTAGSV